MAEMDNKALDTLINVLKSSGADAWEVTDTEEKGWEFYFIRHSLDQHRVKNIRSFSVKVYRKFDDCLGSAKAGVGRWKAFAGTLPMSGILSIP